MSEPKRITETDLDRIEREGEKGWTPSLVTELRRLRGLIAEGVHAFMYAPENPKDPDKAPDEWTRLALEARAIWEEQAVLPSPPGN